MIRIRIIYNGGFPRYHQVSEGFLSRLEKYVSDRPYLDVEIARVLECSGGPGLALANHGRTCPA